MEYTSVAGESVTEKIIERSRFLTYISHAEGEDEARSFLARVRGEHPLATHVCYAFIADKTGNVQRFSDDGEPQGTAGMPILGVLKAQELREIVVAVVRYFGGVKLGAGGLTRAYAGCAAEGLAAADKRGYASCVEVSLTVGYGDVAAALRFLEREEVLSRTFDEGATFNIAVREKEEESFLSRARDFFNGNAKLAKGKRFFYPFPKKE